MKSYRIIISPRTSKEIAAYRDYIAQTSGFEARASQWVERVFDAIGLLQTNPQKFALAEESQSRNYEIRRLLIGKYLALYTIDEAKSIVRVIGFRHGARLPRPEDLPEDPPV